VDSAVRDDRLRRRTRPERRSRGPRRRRLAAALAVNLTLNAGWNWLFFGLRRPKAGLYGALLLDLSNAGLLHDTHRVDPRGAHALVPYAGWCVFATALDGSIVRRNSTRRVV